MIKAIGTSGCLLSHGQPTRIVKGPVESRGFRFEAGSEGSMIEGGILK